MFAAIRNNASEQMDDVAKTPIRGRPAYSTLPDWCRLSGMGRSATYEALGRGDVRAIKLGSRTLIDVAHGLAWLDSLPAAKVRPHGDGRTRNAA